jgi:hypothetical protein
MSMITSAVLAQSSWIGSGSALMTPRVGLVEFNMTPLARTRFARSSASAVPLCTIAIEPAAQRNSLRYQNVIERDRVCLFAVRRLCDVHLLKG